MSNDTQAKEDGARRLTLAEAAAMVGGVGLMRRFKSLTAGVSKYQPHQNRRECERRLRQVRAGQLAGKNYVTDAARYAAHGLVAPDDDSLVVR